jgi:para-nitrobenzyl esterase
VFGHFDIGPQSGLLFTDDGAEARTALSGAMMSWWANFAATGAPGRGRDGSLAEWQPWTQAGAGSAEGTTMMLLDTPAGGGTRMSSERVTRESLLRMMEAEPGDDATRCALFRRTFRFDRDAWTEAAWTTFAGGRCAATAGNTAQ